MCRIALVIPVLLAACSSVRPPTSCVVPETLRLHARHTHTKSSRDVEVGVVTRFRLEAPR